MMRRLITVLALLFLAQASLATEAAFFDSDGVRLRYFATGDGDPVLLLHGFSGSAEGLYIEPGTFDVLAKAGYRAIALDQRGHAGSDKPHADDAYGKNMVEDVRRLLDHLAIDQVHLVGYSMGGKVANTFREKYPERLRSITLGGYGWPWQSQEITLSAAQENVKNRPVLPGNDLLALAAVQVGMSELSTSQDSIEANEVPALAIIGDKDVVVPVADQESLARKMQNLEFVVIPGTHAGPDGAPYKPVFAARLVEFLGRVGRR